MPASLSACARAGDMCPIEAQRLRFVCSATRRAPSSTFAKSRFERPWPWVTMQNRCAPAASAALACSRICSGSIIACIGVPASAYRDWAQKPQSSAQPPDFALTSEHMSVESPKRSRRAAHARSTTSMILSRSSISPSPRASSKVISGGPSRRLGAAPDAAATSRPGPCCRSNQRGMKQRLTSVAGSVAAGRGRSPGAPAAALVALAVLAASAALPGADPATAKKKQRPNVVFVRSDDQTVESMRAMSNVNGRLARYGTTFANSFVNLPVCCPSRATFLTGQYAHNHGTLTNGPPRGGFTKFNADHGGNTLPGWLQRAGYYTAHVGKYMNGYGTPENEAFVPGGWTEWRAAARDTQAVYDYALNENGTLVEYGSSPADFKQDVFTAKAVDVINPRAPARAPFFLSVDYTAPHSGGPNPNPQPPGNCEGTAKPAPRHATAFNGEPIPRPPSYDEADVSDKPSDVSGLDPINANQRQNIAR